MYTHAEDNPEQYVKYTRQYRLIQKKIHLKKNIVDFNKSTKKTDFL